ncbi:MAG: ATP-binding protein, partial [Burkholderiales bacterium]
VFDDEFVRSIPQSVDPCGERGEFHTFAFAGPMFRAPIATRVGEIAERDGFIFADVLSSGAC